MRCENWRDEERDNTSVRQERWRVDKDSGEHRRTEPSFARPPDGYTEAPSLTQTDTLEPLALSSPSPEEEVKKHSFVSQNLQFES